MKTVKMIVAAGLLVASTSSQAALISWKDALANGFGQGPTPPAAATLPAPVVPALPSLGHETWLQEVPHGFRHVIEDSGTRGLDGPPVSAVPVPAAVWLFASGLIGLVGVSRRQDH